MRRREMTPQEHKELVSLETDISAVYNVATDLASQYEEKKVDEDLSQQVFNIAEELSEALSTIGTLIGDAERGEYNFVNHDEYNVVYYYEVPVMVRFEIEGAPDDEPSHAMKEQQLNEAWDAGNIEVNWHYTKKTIRGDVEE